MVNRPPGVLLAMAQARLALLRAGPLPGESPPPDRERRIAELEEEIAELRMATGQLFRLPARRDVDGPDDPPDA